MNETTYGSPIVPGQRGSFGYVYGGRVRVGEDERDIEGTATCPGVIGEERLRAVARADLSRSERVPLSEVTVLRFWFSEIMSPVGTPGHGTDAEPSGTHPRDI